jgi:hypothetical protein
MKNYIKILMFLTKFKFTFSLVNLVACKQVIENKFKDDPQKLFKLVRIGFCLFVSFSFSGLLNTLVLQLLLLLIFEFTFE